MDAHWATPICDVIVTSNRVAGMHARIMVGEEVVLDDMHSANGVWVNGDRVREVQLAHADMIDVVTERFVFMQREDPAEEQIFMAFLTEEMPVEVFDDWCEERGYCSPSNWRQRA